MRSPTLAFALFHNINVKGEDFGIGTKDHVVLLYSTIQHFVQKNIFEGLFK